MVVPPTSPTRGDLRALLRQVRARFVASLAPNGHARLNSALVERLAPLLEGRVHVAGYAAMHDEIDPAGAGFDLWPRVGANGEPLSFHRAAQDELERSPGWGIREPRADACLVNPDAIIVPLIAADARGNRLGYGKGHYDRTLPLHDAPRIGVGFDCQVIDFVPAETWDAPLDWLVTPTRTIRCDRLGVGGAGGSGYDAAMQPSIRKPLGILAILAGLAVYGLVIAGFADQIGSLPKAVEAIVYLVLGIAWLLPLRPLLVWMNK